MNCPRVFGVCVILMGLSSALGCSEGQKLVAITVSPQNLTITGVGGVVPFVAYGSYTHPPESRDITRSVTWSSSFPQAISIDPATGVATTGSGCGVNIIITAALYSKPANPSSGTVAVGTSTVNVKQGGLTC